MLARIEFLLHLKLFQLIAGVDRQTLWPATRQHPFDKSLAKRTRASGNQDGFRNNKYKNVTNSNAKNEIFVKNKTLQHLIYLAILLILAYKQRFLLKDVDKELIEDTLKKMMVIIVFCVIIALKFPQYMNDSFLTILIFGLVFVILLKDSRYLIEHSRIYILCPGILLFISIN